jgi:hypothetical protein
MVNAVGFYYLISKNNKEKEQLTEEIFELRDDYTTLQADFNKQLADLKELKGQNEQLDSIISLREVEIKSHLAEIEKMKKQGNLSAAEMKKAKDLIMTYEKEKLAFRATLDSLFETNAELKLLMENLEVSLAEEKGNVEQLSEDKKFLSGKVELGSLLMADELYAAGIKVKDNGAEKEVSKIKNTDKIIVCYQTGANKVRDVGSVSMYLRLISPDGETMFIESEGSGVIDSKENGQKIKYTKEAKFDYDNSNKKVCIYWSNNITASGKYTAEIYQDGYRIGETSFTLN